MTKQDNSWADKARELVSKFVKTHGCFDSNGQFLLAFPRGEKVLTKEHVAHDSMWIAFACELEEENIRLRAALEEIATTAHCIALSGPATTPTLQDAWGKFMKIDGMATAALAKRENKSTVVTGDTPPGWTREYVFGNGMDCDVYISPEGIAYKELPKL